MKLIKPNVERIDEKDPFKKIEIAGRTCYKSEDKITDDSAVKFYDSLVKRGHTAMLEHATFVFCVPEDTYKLAKESKYLNATRNDSIPGMKSRFIVSGNLRAINESGVTDLLYCLKAHNSRLVYRPDIVKFPSRSTLIEFEDIMYPSDEEIAAHKYTTMRFVCDRGVSHELVRHRPYSFAQESTRYVNYSKNGEMSFIEPAGYENWSDDMKQHLCAAFYITEYLYNQLIKSGATPQQARGVLPNEIKTEVVVTGNDAEWQHFFDLRSKGITGAPHPDMKVVADIALGLYDRQ